MLVTNDAFESDFNRVFGNMQLADFVPATSIGTEISRSLFLTA